MADTVQFLGQFYRSLVQSSLVRTALVVVGSETYSSYEFDPSVFDLPQFHKLFQTADGGGTLGQIEFTATYVSALTNQESVLVIKVRIYIPPTPVLSAGNVGLNALYPTQYCENLGNLKFTGFPSPIVGQRTGNVPAEQV